MGTRGGNVVTEARVASRDGTQIAYWTSGDGPPLVTVHGTTADHTRWAPLLPFLEPYFTIHAMDRRGRGASGDAPDYDVRRESEDVAAVIDAVAEASGSAVDVYGHSYGGFVSLGGALLTANIRKLVLYEPAVTAAANSVPPGVEERMNALLAEGDRDAAVELMFREVVRGDDAQLAALRAQPAWQARVAAAHTIPRELRAVNWEAFDPARASAIAAPTLLLSGGDSPDFFRADLELVASALPNARIEFIPGQEHVADVLDPETFAGHVVGFLREEGSPSS